MNVVVTGGGTVAPIDDVRAITNASSGRFSAMTSEACLARGARVWHIHAPDALLPFHRLARYDLAADSEREAARLRQLRTDWQNACDRLTLVGLEQGTVADYAGRLANVLRQQRIDIAFLAMAVSDFEPEPFGGKLESGARAELLIRCRRTPKVIQSVRDWSPGVYLVGFKLLSRTSDADLVREAEQACQANRADLTVANALETVRAGRHTIHLVRPGHTVETLGPGPHLAEQLVERVFAWAAERGG